MAHHRASLLQVIGKIIIRLHIGILVLQAVEAYQRIGNQVSGTKFILLKQFHHVLRLHLWISLQMVLQNIEQFFVFH